MKRSRLSPSLAAVLSFLWPGLGQWYAGRRRLAATFALPAVAVAAWLLWQIRDGAAVLAARLFSQSFAITIVAAILLLGLWRIVSIGHAVAITGPNLRRRPADATAITFLLIAVVGMHVFAASYVNSFVSAGDQVFQTPGPIAAGSDLPLPSGSFVVPGPSGSGQPIVTPAPNSTRTTVLLTGIDSAVGRTTHLNDTLLVVSVDTEAKTVSMVSVPRDSSGFPLYFGGAVAPTLKINALATYVQTGYIKSPDDPMTTLTKEVGYLLGVPIEYYAQIDIAGFAELVDMVGGVDVNNTAAISDAKYDWLDKSPSGFYLSAGKHHLNGRLALAYVRSRQGAGDSDYTRSARQQEVLQQIEKKVADPGMVLKVPDLLKAASSIIRTNYPRDQVGDMVALAQGFPQNSIQKCILAAPYNYHPDSATTGGVWTSRLDLERIKPLSVALYGRDSAWFGKVSAEPCQSKVRGL